MSPEALSKNPRSWTNLHDPAKAGRGMKNLVQNSLGNKEVLSEAFVGAQAKGLQVRRYSLSDLSASSFCRKM